ncbi:MAG: hypothetical protein ACKVQW_08640 [Pyrinomonadaceae bacterium]
MYWLDVAIIYFALGAPFGVLRITAKRATTPFAYLRMASGYLLWPLVAIRNLARFVLTQPAAQKDELDSIRAGLEKTLFANADADKLYAFREAFYRYAGLAAANAEFRMQDGESRGFPSYLIPYPSSLIRSACISRRDRRKLALQFETARLDILEMITSTRTSKVAQSGLALAEYFADSVLTDLFHSR